MTQKARGYIIQDLIIIALSIVVAIVLVKTQLIVHFLESTKQYEFLGSFVAGVFFTSIFTTAPAIVALGEIAQMQNTCDCIIVAFCAFVFPTKIGFITSTFSANNAFVFNTKTNHC
jgi:hypothetical protein